MQMIALPVEVISEGILPCLSILDLQALDRAYTSEYHRHHLRQVWKSFTYDALDVALIKHDVHWLSGIGARIVSFTAENYFSESNCSVMSTPTVKKLRVKSQIWYSSILKLALSCPSLEDLYLRDVDGEDIENVVPALAQNCRLLHTLHIGNECLNDADIQALCDNCPHLKHIESSYCKSPTDASLVAIANTYPHLQSLCIPSPRFTNDGFIYIAAKCHELRAMSAWGGRITSRGLTALWAANPNLMDVSINYNDILSDNDIIQLVHCCPLLQKLNISHCKQITDAAVIAVAEHCPQLRSLNTRDCGKLSDASLIALGKHCHALKSIKISQLENISDVGIAVLATGCHLLQEFYAIVTNITDAGVVVLACMCRDLRRIRLNCCDIGIAAVSAIAENCPLLSELVLYRCNKVDDACLHAIAQHCRNLTVLEISGTDVSDAKAVISVIKSCRMLREINCCNSYRQKFGRRTIRKYAGCRLKIFV